MENSFEDGTVISGISHKGAAEELTKLRQESEPLTTLQSVTNRSGYTVYDCTWVCAAVWNGSCPGGAHVIATQVGSPGHVQQNINIGVAITKYRFLWHWGDGNFKFVDFAAAPGYYYPDVGATWNPPAVALSQGGEMALQEMIQAPATLPLPKAHKGSR